MKERPILFKGEMVRAILAGRKTQTRRVVKTKHLPFVHNLLVGFLEGKWNQRPLPYGAPGDRLWVRETWQGPLIPEERMEEFHEHGRDRFQTPEFCAYRASGDSAEFFDFAEDETVCRWRPSIHMPRWASRITLEVTGVRVERLQAISQQDAKAEGCLPPDLPPELSGVAGDCVADERTTFAILWNRINGPGSWDANPWVWVVEFKRVH